MLVGGSKFIARITTRELDLSGGKPEIERVETLTLT